MGSCFFIKLIMKEKRYPISPFNMETAQKKVKLVEDAWNTKNPGKVASAYTIDSEWRNRDEFINGKEEIESLFGFNTNEVIVKGNGSVHMEMKIGSLMNMANEQKVCKY